MTFIDLDRLHLKVRKPPLIHEEMDSRYEVTKIGIDTDVIIESRFEVQNVVLIGLLVDILDRYLRVEVFIELRVALLIMIDRSLSQIPLTTVFKILIAALRKG